jgi:hypothetical protein
MKQNIPSFYFLISVLLTVISCNSEQLSKKLESPEAIAAAMVIAASESTGRYIVWAGTSDNKITSLLVEGNSSGATVKATAEGLFIPIKDQVWELTQDTRIKHLCDCDKYAEQKYKGECPPLKDDVYINYPLLQNLNEDPVSGNTAVSLVHSSLAAKKISNYSDYKFSSHVVATIGPYIFTDYSQYALECNGQQGIWTSGYSVLNLNTGKFENILSSDEKEWIRDHEQSVAAQDLNITDIDKLTLSSVEPVYFSMGFVINLHFETGSKFYNAGKISNAYSRSTIVTAGGIPQKLMPYAQVPPVLGNILFGDSTAKIGGWFTMTGRQNELEILKNIFVNNNGPLNSTRFDTPADN